MKKFFLRLLCTASVAMFSASTVTGAGNVKMATLGITGTAVNEPSTIVEFQAKKNTDGSTREREVYLADPTVFTENGKFYMSGTKDTPRMGFTLLESSDLRHWEYARPDSMILNQGQSVYGTKWFWAPQFFKDGDTYICAYCANEKCAVAYSDNILGPYTNDVIEPVDNRVGNIDPFIFRDDDGKTYFYHVRFDGGNHIYVAEFDTKTGHLTTEPTLCFTHTEAWEKDNSIIIMEGASVVKLDGYYYLFYSCNSYAQPNYAVGYASAPTPLGPWKKCKANPIINTALMGENGVGHGELFFDNDGNLRYAYHAHRSDTQALPRKIRIVTLNIDKSNGQPYEISADPSTIVYPTFTPDDGIFTGYVNLQPGEYNFSGVNSKGETILLGTDDDGNIVENGKPFTVTDTGIVRMVVNIKTGEIKTMPIESLDILGTAVDTPTKLEYAGNGVWSSTVTIGKDAAPGQYLKNNIYFALNGDSSYRLRRLAGTNRLVSGADGVTSGESIRINSGIYTITVDLNQGTFDISAPIDETKISVFGSSIVNGKGADSYEGYTSLYGKLLAARNENGMSDNAFYMSSVSADVGAISYHLARYDDLYRNFGRYAILGFSTGEERVQGGAVPAEIISKYHSTLMNLIDQTRADGIVPVVINMTPHNNFISTEYNAVLTENLALHEIDCPTVNAMGAVSDGTGKYVEGYSSAASTPNADGHDEIMRAIVPSLFDALASGKPQPVRNLANKIELAGNAVLTFEPEEGLHSFTIAVRYNTKTPGTILSFTEANAPAAGTVVFEEDGTVVYTSPTGTKMSNKPSNNPINGADRILFVYHNYAAGKTTVYLDNKIIGTTDEKIEVTSFTIGDTESEESDVRNISEVAMWRAAFVDKERVMHVGYKNRLLKSSLEIYATPDADEAEATIVDGAISAAILPNKAQSMNRMMYMVPDPTGIGSVSPDVTGGSIVVNGNEVSLCGKDGVSVEAYTPAGILAASGKNSLIIDGNGVYIIRARFADGSSEVRRVTI